MASNYNGGGESASRPEQAFSMGKFFSFRFMVTGSLMKIIYIIGMVGITVWGLFLLFSGFVLLAQASNNHSDGSFAGGIGTIFLGLVTLLFSNLTWRVMCELLSVLFSMHEMMGSMERLLKQGVVSAPLGVGNQAAQAAAVGVGGGRVDPAPPPMDSSLSGRACPHCGKTVRATATFCGSCGNSLAA